MAKPMSLPAVVEIPTLWLWIGAVAVVLGAGTVAYFYRQLAARNAALFSDHGRAVLSALDAQRASACKGDFLANMSHEIRTPLNSMIGTTELLLETELTPHQKLQLHTVMHSAEALLHVINDILDFSKIESGKLTLEEGVFSPQELAQAAVVAMVPRVREKSQGEKLEILCTPDESVPERMLGDAARIRQILTNLLSNAVKFTARGYIQLSVTYAPSTGLQLAVTDTGIGIADDKRDMIFDKFTQAEGHLTTRHFGGTGLGLTICRQLVSLMRGALNVTSKEGEGSVFTVQLPLPVAAHEPRESADYPNYSTRRALIVDATAPCAQWLRQVLGRMQIRSFIAEDMQSALTVMRQANDAGISIDYLFIDRAALVGDATELSRLQAGAASGAERFFIGMSLDEDAAIAAEFAQAGGHGYVRKPIRVKAVVDVLQQLDKRPRQFADSLLLQTLQTNPNPSGYADYHDRSVLLVEDNRVNRELALQILAKFQIAAQCAQNGREALAILQTKRFDLILMDCQMPEMDGFEASRILHQRMIAGDMPPTPIIALTANAMKGDRERCLEAGMNDYLGKPLRLNDMKTMLQRWFDIKPNEAAA